MRTISKAKLKAVETVLKRTGLIALGLGVVFGFADLKGWLRHSDREVFLEWALHGETGLPIGSPPAQAFMRRFPPPTAADLNVVTHVTKWKTRLERGPVLDAAFNYMRRDESRTDYVTTLPEIREWAAESRYPWLSWILTLIGFVEVLGGSILGRWTRTAYGA